ncbi:pentraxin fusion protein-like isoform X2 [Erpetoichthys calabaricus]|uniref:Pentraxin family member n=1 Tax=Erpetoichthys calabaricus TaxID=27687 RepID=A0A8C4X441_ERPCA|nr:pentraxin fusion protein-like isoform X2 [Erpetoichthys calabaricus]XP_051783386.1 pentraxin fusion protein-like isoform X2 [Erpetoichthys calabaricus]
MKWPLFAFCLLLSGCNVCCEKGLKKMSLIFPEETDNSYVMLRPAKPMSFTAFTLCMCVASELHLLRETVLFSYYNSGDALNLWVEYGKFNFYLLHSNPVSFRLPQLNSFWTNLCVTWESSSGLTAIWVDGKSSGRKVYRQGHEVQDGGIVILGQDQDNPGNEFDKKQSFIGEITSVHLWDYVLPSDELCLVSQGHTEPKGNVIDWNTVGYEARGNVLIKPVNNYKFCTSVSSSKMW